MTTPNELIKQAINVLNSTSFDMTDLRTRKEVNVLLTHAQAEIAEKDRQLNELPSVVCVFCQRELANGSIPAKQSVTSKDQQLTDLTAENERLNQEIMDSHDLRDKYFEQIADLQSKYDKRGELIKQYERVCSEALNCLNRICDRCPQNENSPCDDCTTLAHIGSINTALAAVQSEKGSSRIYEAEMPEEKK